MNEPDRENIKAEAVKGMGWKLLEKGGIQIAQFIIQIFLARLLSPGEYGIVGLLTIFITVSDVFIQQGFAGALIQKKDADNIDYSSVFFANIVLSIVIYSILYFISPYVSLFYNEASLCPLLRVLSLNVIIGSFCVVQNAIISKNLDFKKSFIRNAIAVVVQGVSGIYMAVLGYGAWALVYSKVAYSLVGTIVLCVSVKWKPSFEFSLRRLMKLFSFSSKILGTNLLNTVFNNIHSLIIGKFFTSSDLGYYQRGQQMPQVAMNAIDGSFNEVLFPALSKLQDNIEGVKNALRRSMKTSAFFVMPMMIGLAIVSEQFVRLLLTDKWISCVPYMKLQCIICLFWPFSARTHALNAIGKSEVTFRLSVITKAITLVCIFLLIPLGIYAIMIGTIVALLISFFITSYYINKYIIYSLKELAIDIFPVMCITLCMGATIFPIPYFVHSDLLVLILQVILGGGIYLFLAKIFKIDTLTYVIKALNKN